MWSGAWNKRKLTSQISNRFPASTVGRAWEWWSGGCEFKPHWGQFLMKFIFFLVILDLPDIRTEMYQISLSWKTWLAEWVRQLELYSIDGWCCEFNSQWRQLYFWNPLMSILYKNARNVRFVLFRKKSSDSKNNLCIMSLTSFLKF